MNKLGAGLLGCGVGVLLGCAGGLLIGIGSTDMGDDLLEGLVSTERKADVRDVKSIERPAFTVKHPGNWKVDTEDEDYDPDHMFSIDSPGNCFTMFIVFDTVTDPGETVQSQIDTYVPKLMKSPTQTPFTRWGRYEGTGMKLEGRVLGVTPGSLRVFSHADEKADLSFVVVESCYDEDRKATEAGFELIEDTFQLTGRK